MRNPLFALLLAAMAACETGLAAEAPAAEEHLVGGPFVVISGHVRWPGAHPWTPGLTARAAIKRAGGIGWRWPASITIIRGSERLVVDLRKADKDATQNPTLLPNDEIEVPE